MAEFQDVMRDWKRMCVYATEKGIEEQRTCGMVCPIGPLSVCVGCDDWREEDFARVEERIVKWAEEHPEPPTWRQYLTDIGVLPKPLILATDKYEMDFGSGFAEACALTNTRIPSELWEKIREAKEV